MPWNPEDAVTRNIAFNVILELEKNDCSTENIEHFLKNTMLCKGLWGLTEKEIDYFIDLVFNHPGVVEKLLQVDFYEIYTEDWGSETFDLIFPVTQSLKKA